jgi:zinc and cadmium transporter
MDHFTITAVYCVFIVGASLLGGWLPTRVRMSHAQMQVVISLVAGLMLGVGLLHMLPHAAVELGSLDRALGWTLLGLLLMFFLIRAFHFHQHDLGTEDAAAAGNHDHAHVHGHAHDHDHAHSHDHGGGSSHRLSWLGIAFGLGVHTLIDGLALAATVQAEAHGGEHRFLLALGTFLAIALHKPLDAMSITSLMAAGGWSIRARQLVNAGFALMCPLGAAIFLLSVNRFANQQAAIVGGALGFSAGVFLCISLSDLLPELQFHSHDRFKLSVALLLGVALAYGVGLLEPEHLHEGDSHEGHSHESQPHDTHVHDSSASEGGPAEGDSHADHEH